MSVQALQSMAKTAKRACLLACGKPVKHRDQGWSWVVMVASFIAAILCDGSVSGQGVINKNLVNDTYFKVHNYTAAKLALPGAIQSSCYVVAIGLAGPLVNTFGFQWVGCIGGLTAGLALLASSFLQNIDAMVFFYGALSGLGLGALCLCTGVGVTYYFERFRGVASGLSAAGNGVGYIVVPILLSSMSRHFGGDLGWRSALMVYSIIVTGLAFLCALTLRPLQIDPPTEDEIVEIGEIEVASNLNLRQRNDSQYFSKDRHANKDSTEIFASVPWISGGKVEGEERSKHQKLWETLNQKAVGNGVSNAIHPIHSSNPDISSDPRLHPSYLHSTHYALDVPSVIARPLDRPDSMFMSSLRVLPTLDRRNFSSEMNASKQLNLIEKRELFGEESDSENPPNGSKCLNFFSSAGAWIVKFFDLRIFLDTGFIIICASCVVTQLAYFVPFAYFFTFATTQAGFSENDALLMGTIMGILHTFGRFLGGATANIPKVDIIIVTAVSCILCGLCHLSLPFLPYTFTAMALYSAGYGFLCAVPCPLQVLLFVRFLGINRLTMAISNSCLIKAVAAAIGQILAGKLKSSTGNLDGTFYFCSACFIVSGLILFLLYLPFVKEHEKD